MVVRKLLFTCLLTSNTHTLLLARSVKKMEEEVKGARQSAIENMQRKLSLEHKRKEADERKARSEESRRKREEEVRKEIEEVQRRKTVILMLQYISHDLSYITIFYVHSHCYKVFTSSAICTWVYGRVTSNGRAGNLILDTE